MAASLEGKVAAVTGAASGIGLATAKALLDEGATVVMVDQNEVALAWLTEELGERALSQVRTCLIRKAARG